MQSCGNWSNASNAGSSYRNLNNNRSNDNNNNGFRSCDYFSLPETTKVDTGNIGISTPASAKYADVQTNLHSDITLEKIASMEILYNAFLNARKSKRFKKTIYDFENNVGEELAKLQDELLSKTYMPQEPKTFTIHEPKERQIAAPAFRDSVVQHAIYIVVYDAFDKCFIHDSYGCRKNKGTHKASDKLQRQMRGCDGESYFLQIDIRRYYYNIDHDVLKNILLEKIKDIDVVNLMMLFVAKNKGLHIGSLLSQFYGLVYLNKFDHWVKRYLKIKKYNRYVDDSVFLGFKTNKEAKDILTHIIAWLKDKLKLKLSKWKISKIKRGINYVGFRTWRNVKFIRKRSLYNFSKALKTKAYNSLVSILGNAKHTSSFKHMIEKIKRITDDLQIQKIYRTVSQRH